MLARDASAGFGFRERFGGFFDGSMGGFLDGFYHSRDPDQLGFLAVQRIFELVIDV